MKILQKSSFLMEIRNPTLKKSKEHYIKNKLKVKEYIKNKKISISFQL